MDLNKIFNKQIELDKKINETHQVIKNDDWRIKAILALYVEVGELANEIQSFKYWKKNKTINNEFVKEEYADGLHFLLSFAIDLDINKNIEAVVLSQDINIQFIKIFDIINQLQNEYNSNTVKKALELYLGIAKLINLSDKEIEIAYLNKNKINFERIKNNY